MQLLWMPFADLLDGVLAGRTANAPLVNAVLLAHARGLVGDPRRSRVGRVKVGVPKEVKDHEYRVAITPIGVHELVAHGHEVVIQTEAGVGSGIPDDDFVAAGATIVATRRGGVGHRRRRRHGAQGQGAGRPRSTTGCARAWCSSPTCTWPRTSR